MYKIMKYLNVFSSKIIARAIFHQFHVMPSVKRDLKICLSDHASITNMAAIPIDVENHLKIFTRTIENEVSRTTENEC